MATKRMNESWRRIRSRIRKMYSDTDLGTDKELKRTRGSLRMMVNLIHHKTGEPRSEIRNQISAAF